MKSVIFVQHVANVWRERERVFVGVHREGKFVN